MNVYNLAKKLESLTYSHLTMYLDCDISFCYSLRQQDYSEQIFKFSYSQYGLAVYKNS
jgi:hypothetical protein